MEDGRKILVNRGYVGMDYLDPMTRQEGQPDFPHTITGIIRGSDSNP